MKRIILASASPRRKELLTQVGIKFEVIPSSVDEHCIETTPSKMVEILALQKAREVSKNLDGDYIVIGSDTVVAKDGRIFGKPSSKEAAFEMLNSLQGSIHQVFSGVALVCCENNKLTEKCFHVKTDVEVFPMTEKQILSYIDTGDCMDKAGGYGIQGRFAEYIKGIVGDYYNVVGLPISELMRNLRQLMQ